MSTALSIICPPYFNSLIIQFNSHYLVLIGKGTYNICPWEWGEMGKRRKWKFKKHLFSRRFGWGFKESKDQILTNAFFLKRFYLFIFRERGREGEGGRETSMFQRYINQLPLTHLQLGTWPSTQACALTGIKPATFRFAGQHSIHWATPART